MAMSSEEKAARKRLRMIDTARQYQLGTYSRKFVAPVFQRMVRAEAAATPTLWPELAIVDGELDYVGREIGQCVCVTCGKVDSWSGGIGGMHTGHFIASRRNSILFEEANVAPQCAACNVYRAGEQQLFRKWMLAVRGEVVVNGLEARKAESVTFSREQLVDMRIDYQRRLDAAIDSMSGN